MPRANSSWDGATCVPNDSVDISVAVATPSGLITPIVTDAAGKGLTVISSETGQEKGAKFPTSKAHISVVFHSFWLIFGRVIISRNGLDRERLSLERARAERPR